MFESTTTDSNGYFHLSNLLSTDQRTFSFFGKSSLTFGPFYAAPECTLNVVCKLTDYIPSSAHNPVASSPASSLKIAGITKSKSDVFIVFNGGNSAGDYNIEVFSLNGKKVYSTMVSNNGSGTYSVAWNPSTHAGSYIARISSGIGTVERKFVLR